AFGVDAVAGGAVGPEELLASGHVLGRARLRRRRLRRDGGVREAGHEEAEQEQEGDRCRVSAAGGQCVHGVGPVGVSGMWGPWKSVWIRVAMLTEGGRSSRRGRSTRRRRSASSRR